MLVVRKRFLQAGHVGWRVALVLFGVAVVIKCSVSVSKGCRLGIDYGVCVTALAATEGFHLRCLELGGTVATCACLHAVNTSYGIAGFPSGCVTIQRS